MEQYLKQFTNHATYNAVKDNLDKPNVSYCVNENEVHYNPKPYDYSQDYLTFVALEDGTFSLWANDINYSINNGETWIELLSGTSTPLITAGNKIMWKGELLGSPKTEYNQIGIFSSTGLFDIQGNIMSIICGDNFADEINFPSEFDGSLEALFRYTDVVNAENLILPAMEVPDAYYLQMFKGCENLITAPKLPATTLGAQCYKSMFYDCSSLIKAPELPATRPSTMSYNYMFYGCSNLNYIKCLATDISATYCTSNWVTGVQTTSGTFIGNSDANLIWSRGNNGIPFNWTAQPQSIEPVAL